MRCAQELLGSYTLQAALQNIVNDMSAVADSVTTRILAAENLASYASIHPLYIQATPFLPTSSRPPPLCEDQKCYLALASPLGRQELPGGLMLPRSDLDWRVLCIAEPIAALA